MFEATDLFIWRWSFGELFTYLGPYLFMSMVFPIKKGCKWKMWAIGYGCIVMYLLILFGFHFNPYAEGIALRLLVTLPEYVFIPMLFCENDGWKYVSFRISNSFLVALILDVFLLPHAFDIKKNVVAGNEYIDLSYSMYADKGLMAYFYAWCITTVVMYLLLVAGYRVLKKHKKLWNGFIYVCITFSIVYFSILLLIALGQDPVNQVSALIFAVGNTVSVIGCACHGIYQERRRNILETEVLTMQQQLQEIQAEELLESQIKTRKLRHDLAGHMETLHMLVESGKMDTAKEYAEKVLEEYR